jgi:hypothetical protein
MRILRWTVFSIPSVQVGEGKVNVVLFHKAARVEPLEIPQGTEISAQLSHYSEDGPEVDYWVSERVPPEVPSPPSETHEVVFLPEPLQVPGPEAFDGRTVTLRLDISSLTVHHVSGITFETDVYPVRRHRSVKREEKF